MERSISQAELSAHTTEESCWVVIYGKVWDVTKFLPSHPGGTQAILKLAGQDATQQFDPIHPERTLEEALDSTDKLGVFDSGVASSPSTPTTDTPAQSADDITIDEMLNLDEIEAAASKTLSKKAWTYYASASDDQISKRLNSSIWSSILLRPRVFIDCTKCSTSTELFGQRLDTPIFVSPAAMARMAHPSGELGIAEACGTFNALQIVSGNASMTPEQITANSVPGQVFGWQIYVQSDRSKSEKMLARINNMSDVFKFIVLTIDAPVPGKREDDERLNVKPRQTQGGSRRPDKVVGGVGKTLSQGTAQNLTWKSTLAWLSAHTSLPIVLKGIQSYEDAILASHFAPQVKGIIISNHGGRAADTAPPPVLTLMEMRRYCPEVFTRLEVCVDGGIRRGTDVIKALCLGARAVGVGRAPLYGLAVGGREGVERMFQILHDEMETCMRLLGVSKLSELSMRHINACGLEGRVYGGNALSASDFRMGTSKL